MDDADDSTRYKHAVDNLKFLTRLDVSDLISNIKSKTSTTTRTSKNILTDILDNIIYAQIFIADPSRTETSARRLSAEIRKEMITKEGTLKYSQFKTVGKISERVREIIVSKGKDISRKISV